MTELLTRLNSKKLISPPQCVLNNTHYMVIMGSVAYGVSNDTSDIDIYGFCVPDKELVFPHLTGKIAGFGAAAPGFNQWSEHHILDKEARKEYDFAIYNIVKYFDLCMDNNPNMIDSLFVPDRCVLYASKVGQHVRDNRLLFLHKGAWHRFKGYAYSQLKKAKNKKPIGKRLALVEKYGYDVKFAYHIVRLLSEVEQIMTEHNIDLERNREQLKSIRRGEWTLPQIESYFETKERSLEEVYNKSTLQHSPNPELIKKILLECLEMEYGTISEAILHVDKNAMAIAKIQNIIKDL